MMKLKRINNIYYSYRYDAFSLLIVFSIILWFISPLFQEGHIVFSDLDFPLDSRRYLEEIFGLWNDKWNTPTTLNLPRLVVISLPYFISYLFGYDGSVFIKSFIVINVLTSSFTMYLFSKSIVRVYLGNKYSFLKLMAISIGAVFYAINPWVIYRIQHIYLICGYALLPLALLFFLRIFDPKFQSVIIEGYSPFRIKLYRSNVINIGFLAITISVMSAAIHYFFYTLILFLILWILLMAKQLFVNKWSGYYLNKAVIYNFLIKGIALSFFSFLFCYYWFSVYLGSILLDAQSSQNNINVVDTLALFSKHSSIMKSSLMISYWWPMFDLSSLGTGFYIGGFIILFVISIGIFYYIKRNHLLLFLFVLTVSFLLLSTGTSIKFLSDLFIRLVMEVPFFGNLFRDPNKLIGIVAIGYSVFLVFGVEKIFSIKIAGLNRNYLIKVGLFIVIITAYLFYITPFRNRFVSGFYKPVEVPDDYRTVQKEYINSGNRVLHFPVSGNMLQTSTGVTTLDWNDNPDDFGEDKATGDISIYFSSKNTVFHHEGSDPSASYYINYLQYILDNGLTDSFGLYLLPLFADELAYSTGYLGHEERQLFNKGILNIQKDLFQTYHNEYFNLFSISLPVPAEGVVDRLIYTSKGFHSISAFSAIPGFSFENIGTIYNSQRKGNPLLTIREGDFIESTTLDELLLASLPEKYYLSPAEYIKNGNPFLGWSKSAIHTSDWLWHLKSQNIKPLRFDMSFLSGLALSFSSTRLDIPVHLKNRVKGKKYITFDDFIFDGYSFTADNSSIVDIETYPLVMSQDLPVVHGIISKGQNYNIWQVAKSGLIPAESETPYQFFLTISGRGTNKMHLKARFYNKYQEEVGTAYILTPEEAINFEYFKFYGEYITPKNTDYIRIDILTFQRPEQKTHWWIHDFSITELSDFSTPNTIDMTYIPENRDDLIPYIRLFHSPEGGRVKVKVGDSENIVNTGKDDFSGFLWSELKSYNSGGVAFPVVIENLGGFNCVNEMVIISQSQLEKERFILNRAIEKSEYFISLEAEYDFDYTGSKQSRRNNTLLSMSQGRASFDGLLRTRVDLPRDGEYYISIELGGEEKKSSLEVNLKSSHPEGSFSKKLIPSGTGIEKKGVVIEDVESIDGGYNKEILKFPGVISNFERRVIKTGALPKGAYQFDIKLEYSGESLSSIKDLKRFDPSLVIVPAYKEPVELNGYSECISITRDMISHNLQRDEMVITYDKTCSADWYITSSSKIDVVPMDEYILSFDMLSKKLNSRHSKILYLNSKGQVIKTDFIPEVEEKFKENWNSYQYITKAPEDAEQMLFHIWGRGNKKRSSETRVKNLTIFRYNNLPIVDKVYISEKPLDLLFTPVDDKGSSLSIVKSPMNRKFYNDGNTKKKLAIKFDISPHQIWEMDAEGYKRRSTLNINGLRSLFFVREMGHGEVNVLLKDHYFTGFILWLVGIVLLVIFYFDSKSKESFIKRFKRTLRNRLSNK